MREILFRGKTLKTGDWVFGSLLVWPDGSCEICSCPVVTPDVADRCKVDPDTVGQYTGAKDKHGQRIFEGDILKDGRHGNFEVWYDEPICQFVAGHEGHLRPCMNRGTTQNLEIIANVHDNPELLEE